MNRRYFFQQLASGLVAACAPTLFLPKLIKPKWKPTVRDDQLVIVIEGNIAQVPKRIFYIDMPMIADSAVIDVSPSEDLELGDTCKVEMLKNGEYRFTYNLKALQLDKIV